MFFHFSPPYKNFNMSAVHQKMTHGQGLNNLVRQVRYEFNNKTRVLTIMENPNMIGKVVKITYIVSSQEERKLKLQKINDNSRI